MKKPDPDRLTERRHRNEKTPKLSAADIKKRMKELRKQDNDRLAKKYAK